MSCYLEKFKDSRWQKKRLQILQRDKWKCRNCDMDDHLHVHHLTYFKDRDPWDYSNKLLVTLCSDCHDLAGLVDLKVILTEHIIKHGADDRLIWFLSDLISNIVNMGNMGLKSIAECYKEYLNWIEYSKTSPIYKIDNPPW